MVVFLLLIGFLALGLGVMSLTQVTMGVGAVGGACFFAILARLAQASNQHKQVMEALHKRMAPVPELHQES